MQKSIDNARQIYDTCNIIKRIAMNIYTVKNIKTNSIYIKVYFKYKKKNLIIYYILETK